MQTPITHAINLVIPKFKAKPQTNPSDPAALHKRLDGETFFRLLDLSDESGQVREFIRRNYMLEKFNLAQIRIRVCDTNYDGLAYDNSIDIADTQRILRLLRNYGDLMRHLVYIPSARRSAADRRKLEDAIETHLADTLTHFEQVNAGERFIAATKVVFKRVTYLHISRWDYRNNLRLERIYPALVKLYYSSMDPFEIHSIVRRHRHLRSIKFREGRNFQRMGHIMALIDANAQQLKVDLDKNMTRSGLVALSTAANVEALTLTCMQNDFISMAGGGRVLFRYVKNFTLIDESTRGWQKYKRLPIRLDEPEYLKLLTTAPLEYVGESIKPYWTDLRGLSIPWIRLEPTYTQAGLFKVLKGLDLEEITLQWSKSVGRKETQWLLRRESLKRVTFVPRDDYEELKDVMRSRKSWALDRVYHNVGYLEGRHYVYLKIKADEDD